MTRLFILFLAAAAFAQTPDVLIVLGSDTSTPGINTRKRHIHYREYAFALYQDPNQNAAEVMSETYRSDMIDSYGDTVVFTWWMLDGSLYTEAANTNVPYPSNIPIYHMKKWRGDAIERWGDELTFHYHTWVWRDYDGDGVAYWNQAEEFAHCSDNFDVTLAQQLLEEDMYPVSFRSGWHWMSNDWQARLNELLPFSLHNDWPHKRFTDEEPTGNIFDWDDAPSNFIPYQPSAENYELPGGDRGWNVRSVYPSRANAATLEAAFQAAKNGDRQIVCIWSHLAENDYPEQMQGVHERIVAASAKYPDVNFRYCTGVEAYQRHFGLQDSLAPDLGVSEIPQGDDVVFTVTSDEPIFQPEPFMAWKDMYGRFHIPRMTATSETSWQSPPIPDSMIAKVGFAATDDYGNLTKRFVRRVADDLFLDDQRADAALAGSWTTVEGDNDRDVWLTYASVASVPPSDSATAAVEFAVERNGRYGILTRGVTLADPIANARVELYRNDTLVVDRSVELPVADRWGRLVETDLLAGADYRVRFVYANETASAKDAAFDVVKVSALRLPSELATDDSPLHLGFVVAEEATPFNATIRNAGYDPLTISSFASALGYIEIDDTSEITLAPLEETTISGSFLAPEKGFVADTLLVFSDSPTRPRFTLPVTGMAERYFALVDNDDEIGYVEVGDWQYSVVEAYGASSRYAWLTASADPTATFSGRLDRPGWYEFRYIVPHSENAATDAEYAIGFNGATANRVNIDQNWETDEWRKIGGAFEIPVAADFNVTLSRGENGLDNRALRSDALRAIMLDGRPPDVIDNEDDAYEETGAWANSGAFAFGKSSRYVAMPAPGAKATFSYRIENPGYYTAQYLVPRAPGPASARVIVGLGATYRDTMIVDQKVGAGGWVDLNSYRIPGVFNASVTIEAIEGEDAGVVRADAVRFRLDDPIVSVEESEDIPNAFALEQNFPNPFNPATTIRFALPRAANASVVIYDVTGAVVERLFEGMLDAGVHDIQWNAGDRAGGVYFYRVVAEDMTDVKKMILMK